MLHASLYQIVLVKCCSLCSVKRMEVEVESKITSLTSEDTHVCFVTGGTEEMLIQTVSET